MAEENKPTNDEQQPVADNAQAPAPQPAASQQPEQSEPAQPQPAPEQPQNAQVPPAYQQAPATSAQQPYSQAQPHQPYAQPACPPAPLTKLTGGMKFAWFVIGALVGIPGIILAWLCNVDKYPQVKSDAVKFSAIGFAAWIVLGILFTMMLGGMLAAAVAGYDTGYHGYYGSMW